MGIVLKIEAFSGASGDMFLAALAALVDGYEDLARLPERLHLSGVQVHLEPVHKNGIACRQVHVEVPAGDEGHAHRHLEDIVRLLEAGDLEPGARQIARQIFQLLAEAEAAVHGTTPEQVGFHEVGAVDSLIDIAGTALFLHRLQVKRTVCTPICTGFGMVETQHGLMPVPAPATQRLLLGMPTYPGEEEGERCTPTGAAILKYLQPEFDLPVLVEEAVGYGPGRRRFARPNVLRISRCREAIQVNQEPLVVLETNIDDMPGEYLGREFQERLVAAGALDFTMMQVLMKKGRPGVLLSVLCPPERAGAVQAFLFTHTTTLGIRSYQVNRTALPRRLYRRAVGQEKVGVKSVQLPDGGERHKMEYADLDELAERWQVSVAEARARIEREWQGSHGRDGEDERK